ncbi:MAG: arylesterase [Acidobacteria bacterium]|nr:MAG: arylesterase [Acidobacteriota bacterium]
MIRTIALLSFLLQATAHRPVILAIGDSMTAGYGVARDVTYPAQLENELRKRGYDYLVVNQGVTGSTTTQALSRLTRALSLQPDIVIIQLGGNDASQGIPRNVSRENLRIMIERFKPGGARVFFAGGRFPYLDEVAKELNVPVIPFLEGVQGHGELLIADGIHPNGEGYAVVVHHILTAVEPFIGKQKTVGP